jgi:hypothetical protein
MAFPISLTDLLVELRAIELKDNTIIVVLGASGDLAKKKTVSQAIFPCCETHG